MGRAAERGPHSGSHGYAQASDVAVQANINVQPAEIDGLSADAGAIGKRPGRISLLAVPAAGRDLHRRLGRTGHE
jgi:hypothetical protein